MTIMAEKLLYVSIQPGKLHIRRVIDKSTVESHDLTAISSSKEIELVLKRVRFAYEFPNEFEQLVRLTCLQENIEEVLSERKRTDS